MKRARTVLLAMTGLFLLATIVYVARLTAADSGDVTQLAPGVYFREQTQGCNNGWVVFKDYVLVIDANFPVHAEKVVEAIRKTTDKPIRFVFDTHYHGDHAFGNAIYTTDGAVAVATEDCLVELIEKGRPGFEAAKKERKDLAETFLQEPTLLFDKKIVLDDGTQRVELLHFGHAHTQGDAMAYLPKQKIVFTGDACVNGAFNYTGDSDTAHWIEVLESIQQLDVETVAPGHGGLAGIELVQKQKRVLRRAPRRGPGGAGRGQEHTADHRFDRPALLPRVDRRRHQ